MLLGQERLNSAMNDLADSISRKLRFVEYGKELDKKFDEIIESCSMKCKQLSEKLCLVQKECPSLRQEKKRQSL